VRISVVEDAGHPGLAESAIAAVKHASIIPANEEGHPVAVSLRIPFQFVLR
jgi:outer membrane biosynthesis protein TonB